MLKDELPKIRTELPGPVGKSILKRRQQAIPIGMGSGYPLVIARGEGAMVEDVDGNVFLDWVGGVGVLNIGYSHPEVIGAVTQQAQKYFHSMMSLVTHSGYIELAEKLNRIVPVKGDEKKTMLVNCGAEAVENAVKIAKNYTGRPNIIVFSGAFHGRTSLTMSMTAKKKYAQKMGPFPEGVFRCEYPYIYRRPVGMPEEAAVDYYIERLETVFDEGSPADQVAAIVLEPIQGEGGFVQAPIEWVKRVRKICDEKGIMLVADEVQCGFGRTGRMFASDYWKDADCPPDIIACAKSIGGGLPLGAVSAAKEIMDAVTPGTIGGTFCGNAVACASALKVIEIMERDDLPGRAQEISQKIFRAYSRWKQEYEQVGDVRGIGCMAGIELVHDKESRKPYPELVEKIISNALREGLIIENAGAHGNVIRFLCPLVVTDRQIEAGLTIFEGAIKKALVELNEM